MKHIQTYYRTCNLCEAMRGLVITTQGGRIDKIIGDEKDPLSHGHICPKALAYKDLHEDPDRLKFPAKETPSGWEKISWTEAFDIIASRFETDTIKETVLNVLFNSYQIQSINDVNH